MKYIIFDSPRMGEFPIIFPTAVDHSLIAMAMASVYPGIKPVRAGFLEMESTSISCHGKSVSLKLVSNVAEDNQLISNLLK